MHYISLVPTFFSWWYGRGLKDLFSFLAALFNYIQNMFSVVTLLKTLFQPWKKMVMERQKGLQGFKLWLADNLVSRAIGFLMRLFMIFFFLVSFVFYLIFASLAVIFWFTMPATIVLSFILIFLGN